MKREEVLWVNPAGTWGANCHADRNKKCFMMSRWNTPCFRFCPSPPVLQLGTTGAISFALSLSGIYDEIPQAFTRLNSPTPHGLSSQMCPFCASMVCVYHVLRTQSSTNKSDILKLLTARGSNIPITQAMFGTNEKNLRPLQEMTGAT